MFLYVVAEVHTNYICLFLLKRNKCSSSHVGFCCRLRRPNEMLEMKHGVLKIVFLLEWVVVIAFAEENHWVTFLTPIQFLNKCHPSVFNQDLWKIFSSQTAWKSEWSRSGNSCGWWKKMVGKWQREKIEKSKNLLSHQAIVFYKTVYTGQKESWENICRSLTS